MNKLITFQLFMFSLLFAIIGSVGYWYQISTMETVTINVEDKQRITEGSKSKYIIFAKEETFEDTDSFFHSKFDSADLYGKLTAGCQYEVQVYGIRSPFFGSYRNIIHILEQGACS